MVATIDKLKVGKDLILLSELSKEEIESILDRGDYWADNPNSRLTASPRSVDNPIICNLFFESSTRTRFSFEVAAKKLGYHVLNFDPKASSTQKGETLYDTLKTLESMGVKAAIIRTSEEDILSEVATKLELAIVNAGAGANEHPSQGLLDLLTIRQQFGKIEGLKVAIIGDVKHSRVANSNIIGLGKFNAEVLLAGPEQWMPDAGSELMGDHVKVVSVDEATENADVVIMLRVQRERHALTNTRHPAKRSFASDVDTKKVGTMRSMSSANEDKEDLRGKSAIDNYIEAYGLTKERFERMKDHAIIMHPAPFNRGVEIDGDLIEHERSMIYKQVANGVAVRMAILERAL